MLDNDAISAQNVEKFIMTANFDRLIRLQETVSAEVVGRSREGILLELEMGIPALAPLPDWCNLTLDSGTHVIVKLHTITDRMQVHCRLLRVLD